MLSIDLNVVLVRAIQIAGIVALVYLGYWLLKLLTRRVEKAVEDDDPTTLSEREQRAKTLAQLLNSVGAVGISVAAGLTILNLFIAIGPSLPAWGWWASPYRSAHRAW